MRVTFLRHGATDANTGGVFSGSKDMPLNEEGLRQAEEVAGELGKCRFDVLLHGELERVRQTAGIVLDALHAKPNTVLCDPAIREIDFGLFEGLRYDEAAAKYPVEWKQYMDDWLRFTFPQGESPAGYFERCGQFAERMQSNYAKKNILLVGHKGFILCCMAILCGEGQEAVFKRDIGNAKTLVWNNGKEER